MATIHCSFYAESLKMPTAVNVLLPPLAKPEVGPESAGVGGYPVLYLLHGAFSDYNDLMRLTSVARYAETHRLVIVMPSAPNSFYQDMAHGPNYYQYISEELPAFIEATFPVSSKREDRFIAGLSMGGYGALQFALGQPERFAACASLSGVLNLPEFIEMRRQEDPSRFDWAGIFEDPDGVRGSEKDLWTLAKTRLADGHQLPRLYISCGTEDPLYRMNAEFAAHFSAAGLDIDYKEYPGAHTWDCWDREIELVLEWLMKG